MKIDNNKQKSSEKSLRNMKVALFCLAGILVFYFGANFLKGINAFDRKTYYYAIFDDIGGLQESAAVNMNGYKIGKVNSLSIVSSNPIKICAEILVTEDIQLPKDSKFEVTQKDLMGGMVINVIRGSSNTYAHSGDTLNCYVATSMMADLASLEGQLKSILSSVDTIGLSVKQVFNPADPQNGAILLKSTLLNLEASTVQLNKLLAANSGKVNTIVTKFDQFSTTLKQATPQIEAIIQNIDNISDSLAQANILQLMQNAQSTVTNLNIIVDKLQKGEGSAGKLLNNDSLYQNLDKTTESLNILLQDVKEHPARYINISVFGKKNKQLNN